MQTDLGKNVLLIHPKEVGVTELKTFFLVAHGKQLTTQFGLDKRTTLFYPWGVGQFGWYKKNVGFPLHEILRNEHSGVKQGLTVAGRVVSKAMPGKGGARLCRDQVINRSFVRDF
ncbi:hypothetical protein NHH73_15355 [Oxalobacteraceae bacterium OTU3CINTB1]|nr:hypothetical protein NHH73_15355 [Oxalobacteraceae bacterium OTU3CINTB1]